MPRMLFMQLLGTIGLGWSAFAAPGHRLAKQRRLALRKLAHEPFGMLKRSSPPSCTTRFRIHAARPDYFMTITLSPVLRSLCSSRRRPVEASRSTHGGALVPGCVLARSFGPYLLNIAVFTSDASMN